MIALFKNTRTITFAVILMAVSLLPVVSQAQSTTTAYDSILAKKLGADDYGMKRYVLVLLKAGSETNASNELRDSLFTGHMANINRLVEDGLLVVAGPMGKNPQYQGLFILNVTTIEEAQKLINTDPAVKGNLLAGEFFVWYGSAALQETLSIHSKIEKKKH